jgi:hypothetical protein
MIGYTEKKTINDNIDPEKIKDMNDVIKYKEIRSTDAIIISIMTMFY